jgi:hypothetical protein
MSPEYELKYITHAFGVAGGETGESEQIFIEQGVLQKNLKLQGNIRCRYWMKTTV